MTKRLVKAEWLQNSWVRLTFRDREGKVEHRTVGPDSGLTIFEAAVLLAPRTGTTPQATEMSLYRLRDKGRFQMLRRAGRKLIPLPDVRALRREALSRGYLSTSEPKAKAG